MKVHKAYLLTKPAILYDQEWYFVPFWKDFSSNHQKEDFLGKVISSVKWNKTTFKESYKLTKKEGDWKPPSITETKKYVTEYMKTKEIHKKIGFIIHETTFEGNTSMAKSNWKKC